MASKHIKLEKHNNLTTFSLIVSEYKYTNVIKEEPPSDIAVDPVSSVKREVLLISIIHSVPTIKECDETPQLVAIKAEGMPEGEELFENSQTDFTASNPKCRRLPEHAAQFARHVSSKHENLKVHTNAEDMPLVCDGCGTTFMELINFQTHRCIHMGAKHFEQEVCNAELPLKETCKLPICSDVLSGFKCVVCKDGFSSGSVLQSQILPHSEEDPLKFQACGKPLQYTYKVMTQTGEKSSRCNICGKRFSQFGNLKRHFLTHMGNKSFKCDICGKLFSRSAHVKDHILTHTGIRAFKCDVCDRAFLKSEHLGVHMYTHTGEKPFKCDKCGKNFSRRGHLTVHHLTHTGESQFKCDICGNAFSQKGHLKRHILTHTGEKHFKCDICGKEFSQRGQLKRHNLTHTGENSFKCNICGKAFSVSGNLQRHILTHTGEKNFKCDICGKTFSDSGYIKYHIRTHTGEKPFKCNMCGKGFTIKSKLKYHMFVHIQK